MEKYTTDVLICGAGAAGLTLAIDLARRGTRFQIIEKMAGPFHGSRGKGIQPRSLEIFEDLGVVDRLFAHGGLYPVSRQYGPDGAFADTLVIECRESTPTEPFPNPLMIPQFLTEAMLRERLAELGHRVQYGCELRGIEHDDDGVTVQITSHTDGQVSETVQRVRYLVGADGGRSFVRQTLEIDFPGKTLGVRAMVADVSLEGLTRDAWHRFNEDDMQRSLAVCPLAGTDLFQLQAPVPLEGEVDLSLAGLVAMVAERSGRSDIRINSVSWASAYHMNARLAERYRIGRVFLAGDAAHIHPPTGGQGLNTSVQDAFNLGWKLAAVLNGAPVGLLDTYEEERRPVAAEMLGLSTRLLEAAKRGDLRRGREVHQLDIGYPLSSLAWHGAERTAGLVAGDRACDASIRRASGQSCRLFDLLKGPHWTLIGYDVDGSDAVAARAQLQVHTTGRCGDILDEQDYLRTVYGLVTGDWMLIRPDGYIGAICSSDEVGSLEIYMAGVGL